MTDKPTAADTPWPAEFTQEVLDRLVAEAMAEDQAKLAKAAEKQRRAERRQAGR